MQEGGYSNGIAAAMFDNCYHLATELPKVLLEHTYEANTMAHELARVARGSDEQVWPDDPPKFLIPLLLA
jgi:hypothetical protein